MAFMQQQIDRCDWYEIETTDGTWFIPVDVEGYIHPELLNTQHGKGRLMAYTECHCSDMIERIEIIEDGFGARLSAPGYLDCTDWAVFKTEKEAVDYLDEMKTKDGDIVIFGE
jgi:hypothetical protein|tara:strand:- start:344 stop:682 length:339 start_codon:yes stop_codon:yes gene_type:complete